MLCFLDDPRLREFAPDEISHNLGQTRTSAPAYVHSFHAVLSHLFKQAAFAIQVTGCSLKLNQADESDTMSLSKTEEVALLIEVTTNHLQRLTNHKWNSYAPKGFELANQEIADLKKKLEKFKEMQERYSVQVQPPHHPEQQQEQVPALPQRGRLLGTSGYAGLYGMGATPKASSPPPRVTKASTQQQSQPQQQQPQQPQQKAPALPMRGIKKTPMAIPAIPPRLRRGEIHEEVAMTGYCGLPEWTIPIKALALGDLIGSGRFTQVYREGQN